MKQKNWLEVSGALTRDPRPVIGNIESYLKNWGATALNKNLVSVDLVWFVWRPILHWIA